ncbi:hypothetical protein Taro_027620 [Colocasia esculenta]|uniref:NADH dehydrogenase-like complex N n=1 Tax=Colocasia esculenta TaxID=4460 RepID=A0A843VUU2_COLES|nr:hypothetical protein [Colocasia esculenta]
MKKNRKLLNQQLSLSSLPHQFLKFSTGEGIDEEVAPAAMSCAATSTATLRPLPPRMSPRASAASSSLAFCSGRRGLGAASLRPPAARHRRRGGGATCALTDLIGGDLLLPDLGRWLSDVEEHKALAIYTPHEGGYEGRYFTRLRYQGYRFLDVSARGLGDPEATLTKIHPVCPPHLGRQPIARWYFPPEVDYRLSLLQPEAKGLVVWVIEAKVLSKAELQYLALLPSLRPKVRVIAECGNW